LESHLPHLGILVSGSNTLLFSIRKDRSFQILAETVDDALGEALDKAAKLMGMPYPGGPLVEKLAQAGDPKRHPFPQAFPQADIPKFSFSGLKTSLRYLLEKMDDATFEAERPHLAASFQKAAFEPVLKKAHHHLKHGGFRSLGLSGGVANNECLRQGCAHLAEKHHIPLLLAHKKHTADNASMIAFAHWLSPFKPLSGKILEPSLRLT
jgi:N6-L-threonylcarbamoyladenine synthase